MMLKQNPIHVIAKVRWYKKEDIEKIMPPPNAPSFAANARFKHSKETELFSVILYFNSENLPDKNGLYTVNLHFFAPQMVMPRLSINSELFITEGPKIIGEATITTIISS